MFVSRIHHCHAPCVTSLHIQPMLMHTFILLLMCTYMLVHLHVAFSFFYWFRCTKKKKKKRGVHQPDYLHGLGACLSHRPFQTLRGAPLASCRLRWMHTTALGTGQSQSFWKELTTRPGCASAARAPSASSGNGTSILRLCVWLYIDMGV